MKYEDILGRISPCGISCETCFAFREGRIKQLSTALSVELGNFERYADRFAVLLEEPVFNQFPQFKQQLDYFREIECSGCRKEKCKLFKKCRVRSCSEEKKVDYCFQCNDFPCRDTGFDESLETRWKKNNRLMKETGVEAFYMQTRDQQRYK
jgi:hypothetical protein